MFLIPANILMHIPDGFLNLFVSLACWVITLIILALAVANTRRDLDERLVPLAGIMAAFIFAAQMLNFPVAGGTSGHFIGAALAFIVLGPWLGLLAMTAVVLSRHWTHERKGSLKEFLMADVKDLPEPTAARDWFLKTYKK